MNFKRYPVESELFKDFYYLVLFDDDMVTVYLGHKCYGDLMLCYGVARENFEESMLDNVDNGEIIGYIKDYVRY